MVLRGMPNFTLVPPSSRLQVGGEEKGGTTLVIDMENRPCIFPGRVIEKDHEGFGLKWKAAAEGKRGVTAWVQSPGSICLGDKLTLHIPDQAFWPDHCRFASDRTAKINNSQLLQLLLSAQQSSSPVATGQLYVLVCFAAVMSLFLYL